MFFVYNKTCPMKLAILAAAAALLVAPPSSQMSPPQGSPKENYASETPTSLILGGTKGERIRLAILRRLLASGASDIADQLDTLGRASMQATQPRESKHIVPLLNLYRQAITRHPA